MNSLFLTYVGVFIGLLFGGETILVPAVYVSISGVFNIWILLIIAVVATLVSDSFWYWLGKKMELKKIQEIPFFGKKVAEHSEYTKKLFENHGFKMLFVSKFVYGTRIIAQIFSGMYRMPYLKYLFVDTLAVMVWFFALVFLALGTHVGAEKLVGTAFSFQVSFLVFIIFSIIMMFIFKKIRTKWSQQ